MKKIPKSAKLPCAFCQGKGTQPGAGTLSCIICKGRGRITIKQPYNICKECRGRGKKAGVNLYCWQCHGKGFVEERKQPPLSESSVSKTRRKIKKRRKGKFREKKPAKKSRRKTRGSKIVSSKIIEAEAEAKVEVKKERKSFFEKLFGAIKIL